VCIGESLAERDAGTADAVVTAQLAAGLEGLSQLEAGVAVVAYEPVWAIGTGRPCEPPEAERVSRLIRDLLGDGFGDAAAAQVRILYGGSVTPENIGPYLAAPDIDGALVGGASLKADGFAAMVRRAAV